MSIEKLLDNIQKIQIPNIFVSDNFRVEIIYVVNDFFPLLNSEDKKVLNILTEFIINIISMKYGFEKTEPYYYQWKQNNYRDIKGVILLLLPFIDDKSNSYLLKKITDLNQLLYSQKSKNIPIDIKDLVREEILGTHFEYGNMGISLIPQKIPENSDSLLNLYPEGEKMIYKIIHHNLIGLLHTLNITNGKSYINWVNIVPLNLSNYVDSKIFLETKSKFDMLEANTALFTNKRDFRLLLLDNMTIYPGLWFGDIYNVIRIKLYEEAKPIKWLFFPYEISADNQIYLIQGLNQMISIDSIINSKYEDWDDLESLDQFDFKNKIDLIIKELELKRNITGSFNVDIEILKYTLIYLVSNHLSDKQINGDEIFKKFKLGNSEQDQNDDDFNQKDFRKIGDIVSDEIIDCFKIVYTKYVKELWNYIKHVIEQLSVTSYYKYLIEENDNTGIKRINSKYYYEPFNLQFKTNDFVPAENKINLKNIYNIAKSLSHNNSKDWELLESNFVSLFDDDQQTFFLRIYNLVNKTNWINLRQNLSRQMINETLTGSDYNKKMNEILDSFRIIFINLVFEELVTNGILNKFVLNRPITDRLLLPKDSGPMISKRKELIKQNFNKNKQNWEESYYYLTNDKFKKLPTIRLDKSKIIDPKNKYNEESYFDAIYKDQSWPVFYAMDWISQISFFQHYIYHQVLYVTGATGQGKSTQVPKLLLYALKAIDYKSNGKVICTQPRITPTVGNATRIAEELGLPIEQTSNTSQFKIKTNNYWVQFKHQQDSHTNNKKLHSYLRIVTDGTLLEELKQNPTLFQKNISSSGSSKFINKNIYDIIIVDEAHEHNINMDIILALSKQACYFNNKVKLIVVSATMDDDEPIYRQYFSFINDKLMYPIKNCFPHHPIIKDINYYLPDPLFMDRRYHISPPGETTQYTVSEIYLDNEPYLTKSDKLNYSTPLNNEPSVADITNENKVADQAQKMGYQKIEEICSKTSSGEILFFANGKREILEAVKYLNQVLPPGNIALPFFSELNENYKSIISKIDIKIDTIKNKRENVYVEWGADYIEDMSIPQGLYKRSIIIATNVAEASITIPRLAFVVDNGYAKVNRYSAKINKTFLEVQKISEASRLQRKGRVGRIGDGTVYYMYKRDARKFIRPKYKITQEDITVTMLGLLGEKKITDIDISDINNDSKLIISQNINPNLFDLNEPAFDKKYYTVKSGLLDIYKENYQIPNHYKKISKINSAFGFIYNKYINYTNLDSNQFKLYMDKSIFVFDSGQIIDNILDYGGNFYLIHPFENNMKRNILNNIIQFENIKTNSIPLVAYIYIIFTLFNNNLLIDTNSNLLYAYPTDINSANRKWVKSELALQVEKITSKLQSTLQYSITLIAASAMGCLNEVIDIKLFLETIDFSFRNLHAKEIKWITFKKNWFDNHVKSDLIFIYNLVQKIKNKFSNLLAFNINSKSAQQTLDIHCQNLLTKFKKLKNKQNESYLTKSSNNEPPTTFDGILWNKLSNLKNNGKLLKEYKNVIFADKSILDLMYSDIEKNKKEITSWCNNNMLNDNAIIKFIIKYGEYNLNQLNNENMKIFEWSSKLSSNFNKQLTESTLDEKIIRSFIYGYPMQFTHSTNNKGIYGTMMNLIYATVKFAEPKFLDTNMAKSELESNETLTLLSNEFTHYLMFTEIENPLYKNKDSIDTLNVSILSQISPEWLIPAVPLLINPLLSLDIREVTDFYNTDTYISYSNSWIIQKFKKIVINNWNSNILIWDSEQTPLLRNFYKSIYKYIRATMGN
jgi:HrpA-like RNA helicase